MSKKIDNLLAVFIEDPDQERHIRELARMVKASPTTVAKHLSRLAKEGILLRRKERGHLIYKANSDSQEFKDLKIFHNIRTIRKSGLVEYLEKELNHPEAIVLFGSFAKGENTPKSDLDLFILTDSVKEPNLQKFEKILKVPIQLLIRNRNQFKTMKFKNKELLNNIVNGITISGFLEAFDEI